MQSRELFRPKIIRFRYRQCEIGRSKEFSSTADFGPCVMRISLRKLQELRGRAKRWSHCNASLGAEMGPIDKLLVLKLGMAIPKGSIREIKQTYIDFWTSVETIRANMDTEGYWGQAYTAPFACWSLPSTSALPPRNAVGGRSGSARTPK